MEKKKKLIILGVIILILAISGLTYAILTWTSTKINLGLNSGCFTIDYTKGQDISGNLKLINGAELSDGNGNFVIAEGMGLSYANLGIKSSCTIEGYGSLYLNVTTLSDSFKEGGDSKGALGYALLRNTSNLSNDKLTIENLKGQSFEIIDIKPITNTGTIKLVTEQLSNTELNKYLIVIFVISQAAGNSITSATFQGNISADAEQGNLPTPDYCFNITDKDETNKTASLASEGYNCYSGNSNGYETINDINIPSSIDGYKVTKINRNFLCADYDSNNYYCRSVIKANSVIIPNSVITIDSSAFQNSQLTKVSLSNSVATIKGQAFYSNQLTSITIPSSVTTIGYQAFAGNQLSHITVESNNNKYDSRNNCNAIVETSSNTIVLGGQNTIIPNSVTTIGENAFSDQQLTGITIPNSVITIGDSAFQNNQLTNITIPDSVTTIGRWAFQYNQLTNILIGNAVTTIGQASFYGNQLTNVTIPDSVTTIVSDAFSYNNLNYVLINSDSKLTSIENGVFETSNNSITFNDTIYVNNPNLKTIYNNTGKAFDWNNVVNGNSGTAFVTGTTNAVTRGDTTYNAVTVTTGQPS